MSIINDETLEQMIRELMIKFVDEEAALSALKNKIDKVCSKQWMKEDEKS